jgi:hypothetical protein
MNDDDSDRPQRRLIGEEDRGRFLGSLRAGASREEAAAAAGFPLGSLYNVRARDAVFRLAWEWALDLAAIDERGGELSRRTADGEPVRIAPKGSRLLQRQRMRWVKFTGKRQQIYLNHFAGTADSEAAAAAAGVTTHTVRAHARKHPEFAAAEKEALQIAYAALEAEAVRQRLEAQRRLSQDLEPTGELALTKTPTSPATSVKRCAKCTAAPGSDGRSSKACCWRNSKALCGRAS